MKQKASDIIKRALHLADLSNTDFLTHWEQTQYINDAWRSVYQWLINKGDKQFVKEIELNGSGEVTEYDLPDDLYQIVSLKVKGSNRLINRHAESESDNSETYEIVNNKIRLYGCPGNLILTYYLTPVWITYPDKDINVELEAMNWNNPKIRISDSYKNTILYYEHNSSCIHIKNVVNGEESKAYMTTDDDQNESYYIGDGSYMCVDDDRSLVIWYRFNGRKIAEITKPASDGWVWKTKDGAIAYQVGTVNYVNGKEMANLNPWPEGNEYINLGQTSEGMVWADAEGHLAVYLNDKQLVELTNIEDFDGTIKFIPLSDTDFVIVALKRIILYTSGKVYEMDNYNQFAETYVQYGPLVYTGYWTLKSMYEDTEFNFPNELYFSLIAADLAMRYLMKQNADSSGLASLYQSMKDTFMNTLSQDGAYPRIRKGVR